MPILGANINTKERTTRRHSLRRNETIDPITLELTKFETKKKTNYA